MMKWTWLKKADLKSSTEALICAAQEQALRTNYSNFNMDKSVESPLCIIFHQRGEGVTHVISECSKRAQVYIIIIIINNKAKRREECSGKYLYQ